MICQRGNCGAPAAWFPVIKVWPHAEHQGQDPLVVHMARMAVCFECRERLTPAHFLGDQLYPTLVRLAKGSGWPGVHRESAEIEFRPLRGEITTEDQ